MLTEATDWIGGQLTSQAVPPDEHPWIERFGASASYRKLRHEIRASYRRHYPLTAEARANERLNPGNGSVSALCHEPRAALAALTALLAPYASSGRLLMLLEHEPIAAEVQGDRVRSVTVRDRRVLVDRSLRAPFFLDATELGDLLPLAGVEFVTGAERRVSTTNRMRRPRRIPTISSPLLAALPRSIWMVRIIRSSARLNMPSGATSFRAQTSLGLVDCSI